MAGSRALHKTIAFNTFQQFKPFKPLSELYVSETFLIIPIGLKRFERLERLERLERDER
jgi:hypothetical protein